MAEVLVDTTITVIVLGSLYEGYRRGLITTLLGVVGFATVLFLCLVFGEALSKPLKPYIPLPTTYATLAAYIAICFAIALVAYFLDRWLTNLLAKRLPPIVDAIGGMLAGALRGTLFTALCLVVLMLIANPEINDQISNQSRIGAAFFKEVSKVSPTISEVLASPTSAVKKKKVEKEKRGYEEVVESFKRGRNNNK